MATLTVTDLDQDTPVDDIAGNATAAAGGGDVFKNDGSTFLIVINGATDVLVTATAQNTGYIRPGLGAVTMSNITRTVGANTTDLIGPFPPDVYNNSSGQVALTYDDASNVTVMPVRFRRLDQ